MPGHWEILVIIIAILLLFGAKRIPELARALGRASLEFKKAKSQLAKEGEDLMQNAEAAAENEAKKEAAGEKAEPPETERK